MKNTRTLNGYVVVYKPEHPKAMRSECWDGYVYEHVVMAEEDYGRSLTEHEEVHHLDLDRSNNSPSNLIILEKRSHRKLHAWIDKGAPVLKNTGENPVNSGNPKSRCKVCEKPLRTAQRFFCSQACVKASKKSKMEGVELSEVLNKLASRSAEKVAKDYGLTGNGMKKWLRTKHNLDTAILSETLGTLKGRAETSGEVKSS